ncbi:MAG: hypothetical protein DMG65_06445 [Candidatus Angelobacter sp. Gp1-AA117]|nr:MAG: hypothetical protein DMG65_06445 [Candidatus Angelobacter sp. Gp1-AA117]
MPGPSIVGGLSDRVAIFLTLISFLFVIRTSALQSADAIKVHDTAQHSVQQIELQRCDSLPIIKVKVNGRELPFLLDTGATSFVNEKSFGSLSSRSISVSSWTGTTALNAPVVMIGELSVGEHAVHNVRLPAIDLERIGKACGHPLEGILGVDLIQKLGLTIDLSHHVGLVDAGPVDVRGKYQDMERSMSNCSAAFNSGDAARLEQCFDRDITLYSGTAELHGRDKAIQYLKDRYLRFAPAVKLEMKTHEVKLFGDALWYYYNLSIDSPQEHLRGHGTAICQHTPDGWQIMLMHNSFDDQHPSPDHPSTTTDPRK